MARFHSSKQLNRSGSKGEKEAGFKAEGLYRLRILHKVTRVGRREACIDVVREEMVRIKKSWTYPQTPATVTGEVFREKKQKSQRMRTQHLQLWEGVKTGQS